MPSNLNKSNIESKSITTRSSLFKDDSDSDDDLFKSLRIPQKNTNDKVKILKFLNKLLKFLK